MIKSDTNTLAIATGCAIAIHLVILTAMDGIKIHHPIKAQEITINLENAETAISSEPSLLGIEGISNDQLDDNKVADKKRELFLKYLDDIASCIHGNRFLMPGSSNLIGIASFLIRVDGDGEFTSVRLRSTSGKKKLDMAAEEAVKACSGKVKRPPTTGSDPLVMLQEVRYQYKER